MASSIEKDLALMEAQGVLNGDTAQSIRHWYLQRQAAQPNRLLLVFGVLGVLLVITGIGLLLAHNWDVLSKALKTIVAVLPLLIGQVWCLLTLLKNPENELQRESSAAWLAISIGVCISLISQIYHIEGNMQGFLLTWLLAGLPVVYLMRSSVAGVLYIAGAACYGVEAGYAPAYRQNTWAFWLLLAAILPWYIHKIRTRPLGWLTALHHYAVVIALLLVLGSIGEKPGGFWLWAGYMSMLGLFYQLGNYLAETQQLPFISNPWRIAGWLGSALLLFIGSFFDFWKDFRWNEEGEGLGWQSVSFWVTVILTLGAAANLVWRHRTLLSHRFDPMLTAFLAYLLVFLLHFQEPGIAAFIANLYLLGAGVLLLLHGQQQQRIGILNLGLGIIAVLAVCRFFDTELSFILRGLIFITVGICFVYFNYQLIRRKKIQ